MFLKLKVIGQVIEENIIRKKIFQTLPGLEPVTLCSLKIVIQFFK